MSLLIITGIILPFSFGYFVFYSYCFISNNSSNNFLRFHFILFCLLFLFPFETVFFFLLSLSPPLTFLSLFYTPSLLILIIFLLLFPLPTSALYLFPFSVATHSLSQSVTHSISQVDEANVICCNSCINISITQIDPIRHSDLSSSLRTQKREKRWRQRTDCVVDRPE